MLSLVPAMYEYKDELLISCLKVLLECPPTIIEQILPSCVTPFVTIFTMGRHYLPIADLGLEAMQKWQSFENPLMEDFVGNVVQNLDPFLRSRSLTYLSPELQKRTTSNRALGELNCRYSYRDSDFSEIYFTSHNKTFVGLSTADFHSVVKLCLIIFLYFFDQLSDNFCCKNGSLGKRKVATEIEPELVKLQRKMVRFLGKQSFSVCEKILDGQRMSSEVWGDVEHLKISLPFPDVKLDIYFDRMVPLVVELALYSSDRGTRVTSCELLQALVLLFLGISKFTLYFLLIIV